VIIIDSISMEWSGSGGVLDIHSNTAGGSFQAWAKVSPRHQYFVNAILNCPCHVISTIRTKTEYALQEKNGKYVPEKLGLTGVQRNDLEYEFTIVLDIDIKHNATTSKDRTGHFMDKPQFRISSDTGREIKTWCNQGSVVSDIKEAEQRISECKSIKELVNTYDLYPELRKDLINQFKQRKAELQQQQNQYTTTKLSDNGTDDDNIQR
jgi:hypothetical protein